MDVSALNYFAPVFIFIFIWAIMFAFFQWSKLFGDVKVLHAIMAFVIAFLAAIFSPDIRALIEYVVPWFVFLLIFSILVIIILKMFGVTDDNLHDIIKEPGVYWTILIVAIVILLGGLSNVFGQQSLEEYSGGPQEQSAQQIDDNTINLDGTEYGRPGEPGTKNTATGDFETNVGSTFYNTKVLGMIFLLLVAAIGMRMLSTVPVK